jgi:hypothetical protein
MIGIGRRRPVFGSTHSFALCLLFLDTFQLFNSRDAATDGAHHFLEPHFLLFAKTTDLGVHLLTLLLSPLKFLLHLVILRPDLLQVLERRTEDVTLRATRTNTFGTTSGIEIGNLTRGLATSLTSRTRGHGD